MFVALARGMVPDLGHKISVFIALAPAVFAGPLTTGFPFGALKSMDWKTWRRFFGASSRAALCCDRQTGLAEHDRRDGLCAADADLVRLGAEPAFLAARLPGTSEDAHRR